jgi:hypothetical protein
MPARRRLAIAGALAAAVLGALPSGAAAPAAAATSTQLVLGADVSWPNCPKGEGIPSRRSTGEPMPRSTSTFVIVGLTNGPGFHPNPCIARELRWVRRHHMRVGAYAMTTFPTRRQRARYATGPFTTQRHSPLRNAGYAEAMFNVRSMRAQHLSVPMVWVDVEPYPVAPWHHDKSANRAVVAGAIQAYRDRGYDVGIYTYANGWRAVVGRWRLPDLVTWSTAGRLGHPRRALRLCTRGPSGGPTLVAQWYDPHRDYDLLCPGIAAGTVFGRP